MRENQINFYCHCFITKVNLRVGKKENEDENENAAAMAYSLKSGRKNFAIKSKACIMIIQKSMAESFDYIVKIMFRL